MEKWIVGLKQKRLKLKTEIISTNRIKKKTFKSF